MSFDQKPISYPLGLKHFNNKDYTGGLLLVVEIYGKVFFGENYFDALPPKTNGLKRSGLPTWLFVLCVPLAVMIILALILAVFAVRQHRQKRDGYQAGQPVVE
jgi:hypothetical protein